MARSTVTSSSPVGAGRTVDHYLSLTDGSTVPGTVSQLGIVRQTGCNATGVGASGGPFSATGTRAMRSGRMANIHAAATGQFMNVAHGIDHLIAKPPNNNAAEGNGSIRIICTMQFSGAPAAFPPAAGAGVDSGLCFYGNTGLAGMGNMMSANAVNGNAGFGVTVDNNKNVVFVSRQTTNSAGAPDEVVVLDAASDFTTYNTLDIRFQAATTTVDATLTILVNGITKLIRNWGAGTKLPTAATVGALYLGAFRPLLGLAGTSGIVDVAVSYFRVIKAPDFSDLF